MHHSYSVNTQTAQRIHNLETQVTLLSNALRALLKHCNPDIPPGDLLWNARKRALEVIKAYDAS